MRHHRALVNLANLSAEGACSGERIGRAFIDREREARGKIFLALELLEKREGASKRGYHGRATYADREDPFAHKRLFRHNRNARLKSRAAHDWPMLCLRSW